MRLIWQVALSMFEHVVVNMPARREERRDPRDLSTGDKVVEALKGFGL